MNSLKRLGQLAIIAVSISLTPIFSKAIAEPENMSPKVIFFDVNETLLDLDAMKSSVSQALGGREDLMALWFSTMLHHSLVDTSTGQYHGFGEIGVAALMMVAQNNNIDITPEAAKTAIATPLTSLPPHPDVIDGLKRLKAAGYTIVSLTNSSNAGVKAQFEFAGLTSYFDQRLSIEDIKIYKPNLAAYEWALKKMEIAPEDAMLVAAHGWDIAGAKAANMQAVFVARPGKALYPLAQQPDFIVNGINELADKLVK
ncbi:haloacid dehalogenase type II [Hirschia litorea]|uniref:(S)-2-haloacid dehalogenase n=1 Tax=Hirschia litorea TaxID=1199156 RepID=A0ABW2IGN5_9PROT